MMGRFRLKTTATALLFLAVFVATVCSKVQPVHGFAVPRSVANVDVGQQGAKTPLRALAAAASAADGDNGGDMIRGGETSVGGGTATIPNEVFNLVKSIAGAGVLSLPYGVAAFGNAPSALIPACALIGVMGVLSAYTFGLIGRVCQSSNTNSYAEAWDATVGRKFSPLIAFSCFIDCFAGNLSYSMILADTVTNLLAAAGVAVTRTQSLLGVTGVVLLPLCLLKNLSSLAPFSLVGIIGLLYTTVAMGLRWFTKSYQLGGTFFDPKTLIATPVFGNKGASAVLSLQALILTSMLSNAYIAHFNAPTFLKELKNNTMARFHQVIAWSFGTSIALYSLVTAFGFLTFGGAADGLILNNYSVHDKAMSLARIAITISITCSYPLIFVGTRDGLLDLFQVSSKKRSDGRFSDAVTLAILAVTTALASQLRDLGLVASVGGATFGTALVFVYPAIMFAKSTAKRWSKWETPLAGLIGALGVVMGAIGTALSLSGADV